MNDQHVPFGAPTPPEPPAPQEAAGDEAREPGDGRAVRAVLASAAAVAVLGGGTLGFLWLSSTPGGDIAGAVPGGVRVQPSVSAPADGGDAVAFAASGRDIFGRTVGPTPVTVGSGDQTGAAGASTGSTGGSVVGGLPGGSVGGPVGGGTTVPTAVPTAGPTTAPGTTTPPPPPVTTPPTPSDTRSTAPGWTVPQVSFVVGDNVTGVFKIAGEYRTVAKGELIYPLSVRYDGVVEEPDPAAEEIPVVKGIFRSEHRAGTGWIVESDPKGNKVFPKALVGDPAGRARVYGVLGDRYWISVERQPGVLHAVEDAVAGTGLTFLGAGAPQDGFPVADVYFVDGNGNHYFGTFGGGEQDGVAF
ncbi:hypothetical protein [Kineococcus terrestris]|uniref:hypothetical protein n=1 Tax=Kineococcus terrestris TaxID=2044856 RepID=UPI0034DB2AF7